jgi:septal ring factor EnvC (AmiA/AmiB activator)
VLIEAQGQCIEALEADLERLQHHGDDRDNKLRDFIRELEARNSHVDKRLQLLSKQCSTLGANVGRIKRTLCRHPMGYVQWS